MADAGVPSKAELLEMLRASGDDAVRQLRALPEAAFAVGRYEDGWDGRQVLAHIASIEWTYGRLIDLAQAAPAQPATATQHTAGSGQQGDGGVRRTSEEESGELPTRAAAGGIDAYNERQVEKRAGASAAELIDEFARNRARTIAAVAAADEALFPAPIRSAGGITGPLGGVLRAVAVEHVMGHVGDITGEPWTGRRW
ncbi:MAG: maleylpyruvate isomerase N-terminal domain-containing protein [Chloroflexota bacterium]|nr:maleylpyruvate isomerase N-terminal domain-containing protein [Chloroflexota bacterium]